MSFVKFKNPKIKFKIIAPCTSLHVCCFLNVKSVDDRTEPKIPKFRCFGNFGSVRFGSVRLKNTEPKQIEEFRFNNKLKLHIGSEICKKFSSKSVYGILYKFFFVKLNTNDFFTLEFAKNECDIAQNQCI